MTVFYDSVRETSSTSGTGTLTLAGAFPGFESFTGNVSDNDICYYEVDDFRLGGTNREVGIGKYTSNTLQRLTVLSSTNSDALVSFDTRTKDVRLTIAAQWFDRTGKANRKPISQTSHGFVAGEVLRFNGTSYVKALADTESNSQFTGIVDQVIDTNNFFMALDGYLSSFSGLTAGAIHYLSSTTAGALSTTPGTFERRVLFADSTTSGFIIGNSFLKIPEQYLDITKNDVTATHRYYGGTDLASDWHINKYDRSDVSIKTTANEVTNPAYDNLNEAWTNRLTLTYN